MYCTVGLNASQCTTGRDTSKSMKKFKTKTKFLKFRQISRRYKQDTYSIVKKAELGQSHLPKSNDSAPFLFQIRPRILPRPQRKLHLAEVRGSFSRHGQEEPSARTP